MERHEKRPVWPFAVTCSTIVLVILGLLYLGTGPAYSQQIATIPVPCFPIAALEEALAERGQVTTGAIGIQGQQVAMTVYSSPGGAEFTVVTVNLHGFGCILFQGTDWFPGENPVEGDPA